MSRMVLIVDSSTGKLIDAMGLPRETGRYAKFANRLMSSDKNPVLDYGGNGGDSLTVSKNGAAGRLVNIMADEVSVSGDIKSKGRTMEDIAKEQMLPVLDRLKGTDSQIAVSDFVDPVSGKTFKRISLDPAVSTKMEQIIEVVDSLNWVPDDYVSKENLRLEVAGVIDGISFEDEDDLSTVKAKLNTVLERVSELLHADANHGNNNNGGNVENEEN